MTSIVEVSDVTLIEGGKLTVTVAYSTKALYLPKLVWQAENTGEGEWDASWHEIKEFRTEYVNGNKVAVADVQSTGTFKVINEPNVGPIAALSVAITGFVLALCWVIARKMGYCGGTKPKNWPNETQ